MRESTWVTLAIIGALFGGCVFAEHRAEAKAKAFCSRFTVGGDFNKAIEAVDASGAYHGAYESSGEKRAFVSYMGVPPFLVIFVLLMVSGARLFACGKCILIKILLEPPKLPRRIRIVLSPQP